MAKKIVVIGAGVGGLVEAARDAAADEFTQFLHRRVGDAVVHAVAL